MVYKPTWSEENLGGGYITTARLHKIRTEACEDGAMQERGKWERRVKDLEHDLRLCMRDLEICRNEQAEAVEWERDAVDTDPVTCGKCGALWFRNPYAEGEESCPACTIRTDAHAAGVADERARVRRAVEGLQLMDIEEEDIGDMTTFSASSTQRRPTMPTNIRSLSAARAEKEGRVTPEGIYEAFGGWIDSGTLEAVVVVYLHKNNVVNVGWSDNNSINVLGLLETAKQAIIDEMRGE